MLEKIKTEIRKVLNAEDFTSENAKAQALALFWVLELLDKYAEQEPTDKSNLEKICEELAAENDDLRDQLAMRDRFKQEPCDDAIRRQAVLDLIADYDLSMGQVVRGIHALPPVTPQEPRKGHWIEIAQYSDGKHKIECSECKSHIFDRGHANSFNVKNKYKFCPNCGARMESEG